MLRRLAALLAPLALACPGPRPTYVEQPATVDLTVTAGTATLTWRKGVNAAQTLVVRTQGTVEATPPPDAVAVGDELGGGPVRFLGDGERFVDTSLPAGCGPFAWHLWSRADDGSWSAEAATVRSLRGAHTLPPSAQVTGLSAATEAGLVRLSWTPPDANTGFEQVTVVRKAGAAPQGPTDGTVVYSGPSSQASEPQANLPASQAAVYAVFNCNGCGRCADGPPTIAVTRASADAGVDLSLTGLAAVRSADRQRVELQWATTAPAVRVLRTLNGAPTGPMDPAATVVFDGAGTAASERVDALLPSTALEARTYTYTAWGCGPSGCGAQPSSATLSLTVTQALQGGGYTLAWRHASASTGADNLALGTASTTSMPGWWKSCDAAVARQLTSPAADDEMNAVKAFFQGRAIPVGAVRSSEYCRCVRTAEGFAFGPSIEQRPELTYFVYDEANRCAATYGMLGQPPPAGTNLALVGHAGFPSACAVLDGLAWGEAAVFKPVPGGPPRFLLRVKASEWAALP